MHCGSFFFSCCSSYGVFEMCISVLALLFVFSMEGRRVPNILLVIHVMIIEVIGKFSELGLQHVLQMCFPPQIIDVQI